jgi:hypothetical protein
MKDEWRRLLASALASDVLFDEGVEAARNACVAGASIASAVIVAAAWYDNPLTGLPALRACMKRLSDLRLDVGEWQKALCRGTHPETGDGDFSPGFGFVNPLQAQAILDACRHLVAAQGNLQSCAFSAFFWENQERISAVSGPLNQAGLAALMFVDHRTDPEEAERSFLLWRIDTAVAAAERARRRGVPAFPFFTEQYVYEGSRPAAKTLDMQALLRQVGLG